MFLNLSEKYGETYLEIIKDNFEIDYKIPLSFDDDTPNGILSSIGDGIKKVGQAFKYLNPDLLIVLGDRYEILATVYCATIFNIPIAHLCGGDTTEGAYDDNIRHAITKLSHLHFVTNEISKQKIIQMGEEPDKIFNFGNPGLEELCDFIPIDKDSLVAELRIVFNAINIMVVYHPITLSKDQNSKDLSELTQALHYFCKEETYNLFIIGTNSDNYNDEITTAMENLSRHNNIYFFKSLNREEFLSLAYYSNAFVGNSSSGVYEVPFLNRYVINIGDRQKGRLKPNNVLDTKPVESNIIKNIEFAINNVPVEINHVYKIQNTSHNISETLQNFDFSELRYKKFNIL